jgi:hypothetical protein
MGCNYYVEANKCECCGRKDILHIGKSSCGWNFSLHVIPDRGLNTLDDWKEFLVDKSITDEYDKPVEYAELIDIISNRKGDLLRHRIGEGGCIGHGEGTYDYLDCEFS